MAERQSGETDFDDAERVRFSKKLDGYEAMGLEVAALRQLLDDDIGKFKETYLREIRAQLEGGGEEKDEEEPAPEEEPEAEISPEEEEAIAGEEADEELELELEGAGPEAALLAIDVPEESEEEATEVTPDEEIRISFGEPEDSELEEAPEEEEAAEEEEAPEEEEAAEEEEIPEEEEEAPSDIEADEKIEEEPAEEADEADIQVASEETTEEVPEEEEEEAVEDEEALIVVASVVEEAEEGEPAPEEETEILLSGIEPEEEPGEEPIEEAEEEVVTEALEEEAPPSKKVRPRPRPVTAPKSEPPAKPAAKAEPSEKAKVKPSPATVRRRRGLSRGVIAIIVAAVVVIAGMGSYFMFFQNEDPIALFTWDPEEPTVGQAVGFDARASYDPDGDAIAEYRWNFGDGSTGKGMYVEHSFLTSETFTVRLTIEDERGGEATTHRKVTVEPLTVSMEQPREGDFFEYRVSGSAKVFNYAEGLITFRVGNRVYKVYEVDATDVRGTKTFEVTQMGTAVDGFMKSHDVRTERTIYDLDDISGNISTEASINPSFTGSMKATIDDDICLHWERSIRSTVAMDNRFSAPLWADVTTTEDGVFYGQLDGIEDAFSMDEFLRTTSFVSDDREEHEMPVGDGYLWQVQGMERVQGRQAPSIVVRVTMDDDTLEANHLVSFFSDVWLEPGLSQPAKSHIYTKGRQDGNQFEVNLTETLSSFSEGSGEATGACSGDHDFSQKEENPESFIPLDLVPEQGGALGHFKFSPEEALVDARTDSPDLDIWLNNNPGAFFHLGNYTEIGGDGQWVMSFGKMGLSEHYKVDVIGPSTSDLSTKITSYTDNQLPLSSQSGIGEVATLSHGLRLMKEEPNIASRCFPDQTPDWNRFTFNVTEGVNVLSLDPGSALSGAQETGYVYLLVSRQHNPEYKAALDAMNGQILFSWTHSYTFDPFA